VPWPEDGSRWGPHAIVATTSNAFLFWMLINVAGCDALKSGATGSYAQREITEPVLGVDAKWHFDTPDQDKVAYRFHDDFKTLVAGQITRNVGAWLKGSAQSCRHLKGEGFPASAIQPTS